MDPDLLVDVKRLQQVYDAYGLQTFEYHCLNEFFWQNGRSPLFRSATPDGLARARPDGQLCGGLIEIKYPHYLVGERVAWTDEWTEAIREDERIPWSPGFLRRVYAYDGTAVMMPDTLENQQAYPQNVAQRPGLGFPIAKIAAVFSLACGAVIDLGICRYAGKGQSELGLLRTLMNVFLPGDVMLGDLDAHSGLKSNLIRTIMAQAATKHGMEPRTISFKGAVQTLTAFQPLIAIQGQGDSAFRTHLYAKLLEAVAAHRVADRPDRFEPRRKKRRNKRYDLLTKPRHEVKREVLKRYREKSVPFVCVTSARSNRTGAP